MAVSSGFITWRGWMHPGRSSAQEGPLLGPCCPQTVPRTQGGVSPFPLALGPDGSTAPDETPPAPPRQGTRHLAVQTGAGAARVRAGSPSPFLRQGQTPRPLFHQYLNLPVGLSRPFPLQGKGEGRATLSGDLCTSLPTPRAFSPVKTGDLAPLCNLTTTL